MAMVLMPAPKHIVKCGERPELWLWRGGMVYLDPRQCCHVVHSCFVNLEPCPDIGQTGIGARGSTVGLGRLQRERLCGQSVVPGVRTMLLSCGGLWTHVYFCQVWPIHSCQSCAIKPRTTGQLCGGCPKRQQPQQETSRRPILQHN
eukprot:5229740-Amphidinium_carterae.1